jgi:hypothetical protein
MLRGSEQIPKFCDTVRLVIVEIPCIRFRFQHWSLIPSNQTSPASAPAREVMRISAYLTPPPTVLRFSECALDHATQ